MSKVEAGEPTANRHVGLDTGRNRVAPGLPKGLSSARPSYKHEGLPWQQLQIARP